MEFVRFFLLFIVIVVLNHVNFSYVRIEMLSRFRNEVVLDLREARESVGGGWLDWPDKKIFLYKYFMASHSHV